MMVTFLGFNLIELSRLKKPLEIQNVPKIQEWDENALHRISRQSSHARKQLNSKENLNLNGINTAFYRIQKV
jgi:hypothetical protein